MPCEGRFFVDAAGHTVVVKDNRVFLFNGSRVNWDCPGEWITDSVFRYEANGRTWALRFQDAGVDVAYLAGGGHGDDLLLAELDSYPWRLPYVTPSAEMMETIGFRWLLSNIFGFKSVPNAKQAEKVETIRKGAEANYAVLPKRALGQDEYFMISSRFDGGPHESFVRRVTAKLSHLGTPVYIVKANIGQQFGPKTMEGLTNAAAMIAFCSCKPAYGEKTASKYSTYWELKYANENDLPIIAVQMGDEFPPKTPERQGTAQNRWVLASDLVRIDGRGFTEDALAGALHAAAQQLFGKG